MKKLLPLLVLLSVLFLISCDSQPPAADTPEITIDLTQYTIVRPEQATDRIIGAAVSLKQTIDNRYGIQTAIGEDWIKRGGSEDEKPFEICVGRVNRTALSDISFPGSCFTIRMAGSRLFLLGSDDFRTLEAVEYFTENLLPEDGTCLTLPADYCYTSEPVPMLYVLNRGESYFSVVYDENLDNIKTEAENDRRDWEVQWAMDIAGTLNDTAGKTAVTLGQDWDKQALAAPTDSFEILIGTVNRYETHEVMKTLAPSEYTVRVVGNKIVLFGWNLTTLQMAVDAFEDLMQSGITADASFGLAEDFNLTGSTDKWFTDIPPYTGGTLTAAYDAGHGALALLYEDTDWNDYDSYCTSLTADGFSLYLENMLDDNTFATYVNQDAMVHLYWLENTSTVRIVTSARPDVLPPVQIEPDRSPSPYPVTVTQMGLDYDAGNFGMSYIFTLSDGGFVIYDGGGPYGEDEDRLYSLLKTLCPVDEIHIEAWILTHAHGDHYGVLTKFASKYGNEVKLDTLYMNTPDYLEMYNTWNFDQSGDKAIPNAAAAMGGKICKLYTGQYFYTGNGDLRIDVLYTHEALFPTPLTVFNNSSMVTKVRSRAVDTGSQSILFLGDTQTESSGAMTEMYDTALKSDIVQVAHHGYDGASLAVYKQADPAMLLWPTSSAELETQTRDPASGTWYYRIDYSLRYDLHVKEFFPADRVSKQFAFPYEIGSGNVSFPE
ncbi:MAG: MBL fold metallo-hydrolase [Clostridia bacterium]|nr:MBL fold metallo-hydrolase [Clostridia bacterium]